MDSVTQAPRSQDWGLRQVNNWQFQLCWMPKTCYLSGKPLWGKKCYKGSNRLTGLGTFATADDYYVEKNEFIIWNLTRK